MEKKWVGQMKKVSIRDVAQEAGVSITTVSRALNGYSDVSEKTKARIQEIVQRLDYAPDGKARAMGSKAVNTIGLLLSNLAEKDENGYVYGHMCGLYTLCSEYDCEFVLLVTESEHQKMLSFRQLCSRNNLSGIVVAGLRTNDPYYEEMMRGELPCALVDMETSGENKCTITIDNAAASQEAVQHLIDMGHRRIAMINGNRNADVSLYRYAGYRGAMAENHIETPSDFVRCGDFKEESAYEQALDLLKKYPDITAFFCASDMMALGAIRAAYSLGKQVPGDISVMGFDDIPVAKYVYNGISTVRQDPNRIGYEAGLAVYKMLQGEKVSHKMIFPHELILRASTGKAPV